MLLFGDPYKKGKWKFAVPARNTNIQSSLIQSVIDKLCYKSAFKN